MVSNMPVARAAESSRLTTTRLAEHCPAGTCRDGDTKCSRVGAPAASNAKDKAPSHSARCAERDTGPADYHSEVEVNVLRLAVAEAAVAVRDGDDLRRVADVDVEVDRGAGLGRRSLWSLTTSRAR